MKISNTKQIDGITYATEESRSEIFADDTSIFMKRNSEYIRKCVGFLKSCTKINVVKLIQSTRAQILTWCPEA